MTTLPRLSPAELEVMKVMWAEGRSSAREVHGHLAERLGWAYSTTRTTVERLVKKGVLHKAAFHGLNLYEPAITKAQGLAKMVQDFASQVLEISHVPVVSLFADSGALSAEEVEELRGLLGSEEGGDR